MSLICCSSSALIHEILTELPWILNKGISIIIYSSVPQFCTVLKKQIEVVWRFSKKSHKLITPQRNVKSEFQYKNANLIRVRSLNPACQCSLFRSWEIEFWAEFFFLFTNAQESLFAFELNLICCFLDPPRVWHRFRARQRRHTRTRVCQRDLWLPQE